MKIEVSRRKFLQGSVALTIFGGSMLSSVNLLADKTTAKKSSKSVPTLCEMCVNKCAVIAEIENGIVKNLTQIHSFQNQETCYVQEG
jgi:thiosulfate reductase/polysulfide reductase chain A